MDYRFSGPAEEFRTEVVSYLTGAMARAAEHADSRDLTGLDERFERRLHAEAGERGWLDMGGEKRAVFQYEVARADAPLIDTAMTLAGAAVSRFGSDEQRGSVYEAMRRGAVEMCIAFTEEDAGSDLTRIATTASEIDGGWELHGRKVLVTGAHKADFCVTIALSDPGPSHRESMSMFLVPMATEGVEVVRRPTMNGWTLDEIVFDQARLEGGALLGRRGAGWRQMGQALSSEGSGMFHIGFARHVLDLLIEMVKVERRGGRALSEDPVVRETIAELTVELTEAERLARRAVWQMEQGKPAHPLGSMVKVIATELLQRIAERAGRIAGPAALERQQLFAGGGRLGWEYLERVHGTIGAGANEVHRDGIATAILGPVGRKS